MAYSDIDVSGTQTDCINILNGLGRSTGALRSCGKTGRLDWTAAGSQSKCRIVLDYRHHDGL